MKKVLVFGASNSLHSLNKQLAFFASSLLKDVAITKIELQDYEMPIYGIDREKSEGIPAKAQEIRNLVESHDGMLISLAEHNGAYTTVFKNIFDWISRIPGSTWGDKPMLLLATSPGKRGGTSVLNIAANRFPWNGGEVVTTFSLPSFHDNFTAGKGITNTEKLTELKSAIGKFVEVLHA